MFAENGARSGRRAHLPAQAGTPGAEAGRRCRSPGPSRSWHPSDPGGRSGDTGVLPRRLRPSAAGQRADSRLRRTAQLDPPGASRAGDGRAERGHAEDHRMGGGHRRTDDGVRGVRHELRPHAGAALAFRLPHGHRRHIRRLSRCCTGASGATAGSDAALPRRVRPGSRTAGRTVTGGAAHESPRTEVASQGRHGARSRATRTAPTGRTREAGGGLSSWRPGVDTLDPVAIWSS